MPANTSNPSDGVPLEYCPYYDFPAPKSNRMKLLQRILKNSMDMFLSFRDFRDKVYGADLCIKIDKICRKLGVDIPSKSKDTLAETA